MKTALRSFGSGGLFLSCGKLFLYSAEQFFPDSVDFQQLLHLGNTALSVKVLQNLPRALFSNALHLHQLLCGRLVNVPLSLVKIYNIFFHIYVF